LDLPVGRTACFGGGPFRDTDSRSLFHFPHRCRIGDFRRFISISLFLTQSTADFTILGEMTDADKRVNPLHFGSDPADVRIWINPDSNPRSLLFEILALAEVYAL